MFSPLPTTPRQSDTKLVHTQAGSRWRLRGPLATLKVLSSHAACGLVLVPQLPGLGHECLTISVGVMGCLPAKSAGCCWDWTCLQLCLKTGRLLFKKEVDEHEENLNLPGGVEGKENIIAKGIF